MRHFASGLCILAAGCAGIEGAAGPMPDNAVDVEAELDVVRSLPAAPPATPGGTWTRLAGTPFAAAGMMLLLTDGTVIVSEVSTRTWRRLTPDANGNYLTGTWSTIALMPAGYTPLYFGSSVLPDGRVMIEGGEYINNSPVWSNKGAVYNPVTNTWASVAPPPGWTSIGDASAVVLANGTYMQSDSLSTKSALLNPTTMTWTATGAGKQGSRHDEESWASLWDGTILTVDCNNTVNLLASEIYTPSTGRWTLGANTANKTCDINPDGSGSHENGPMVVRYDGTVIAFGGTGHNDVYSQSTRTWSAAPDSPIVGGRQLDSADGPAVLLPNGNVLVALSPGIFLDGTHMYEWDGVRFTEVAAPADSAGLTSFQQNFMLLPNGEVLRTAQTNDIELYRPTVRTPVAAAVPVINSISSFTPARGSTQSLTAQRMNGLSEAVAYGDDATGSTNYPIVRITSVATGRVFYARTFGHSTRAISPSVVGTTSFTVPAATTVGAARIEVVANGIPSPAVNVTIM